MVGGPQIGYNYPGLTMEIGLYGPTLRARGATSAPFPGYMLIGRGQDFAWTLTSAGADIIDTYAERLCGGSRTRYVYKGKCRKMKTVNAGTIAKGEDSVKVRYRETVHGPVVGYARVAGGRRVVALAQKRSSRGRETTDQIFFQRLSTGRVTNAQEFIDASKATPQTFNSFYVDDAGHRVRHLGPPADPAQGRQPRPAGRRPRQVRVARLPRQRRKHPQDISPDDGLLVNWNNKPAKDFPAGDERWDEGGTQRVDWLLAELAKVPKHTPATVLGAANAGATADPRGLMWPAVKAVLDRGTAPSPLAAAVVDQITAWSAGDASWVDANGDGTIDAPGQAAIAAVWQPLARPRCAGGSATTSARRCARASRRSRARRAACTAAGTSTSRRTSGRCSGSRSRASSRSATAAAANVERCAADLWAAIEQGANAAAQTQGTADPARWKTPTVKISFSPLPLVDMQYTNRPSGIHQVMQFAP